MQKVLIVIALMLTTWVAAGQQANIPEMKEMLEKEGKLQLYINFESAKSELTGESTNIVDGLYQLLQAEKSLKISIEGHTDNGGDPKKNMELSQKRADAVLEALAARGIDRSRLKSAGWGAERPLTDNNTEDAKARNRRVEIVRN